MTISAVTVIFFAITAAGSLHERSFGLTTVPARDSCALLVSNGDRIDARSLTSHERLRLMVPRPTDRMMIPVHRMATGGAMATMLFAPSERGPSDTTYLRLGALLLLMLLGLYVLWRGRDAASFGLGLFFAMIPAFFLSHAYAQLPDQAIVAVLFAATVLNLLGYFGLYLMVDALAARALQQRLRLALRCIAVGALSLAGAILISSTYGRVFTGCPPLINVQIVLACYAAVIGVCFALLWRGIAASEPADRGRLRWVFWSTAVGYSGPLVSFAFIALHRAPPLGGLVNVTFAAIPAGYTYAVLRHRVIDVGFVLNRALSLTILTSAIVVLFIVAESLIEHLAVDHAESMLLQLAFSVGLGMTFDRAHRWLEPRIERLLFSRLYALEASLRELGERAELHEDEDALLYDAIRTTAGALALRGCAAYRESRDIYAIAGFIGGAEFPAQLDDPATFALALRMRGRIVGGFLFAEDPQAEALVDEVRGLLQHLGVQLSAAIAALRAERYERALLKGPS